MVVTFAFRRPVRVITGWTDKIHSIPFHLPFGFFIETSSSSTEEEAEEEEEEEAVKIKWDQQDLYRRTQKNSRSVLSFHKLGDGIVDIA